MLVSGVGGVAVGGRRWDGVLSMRRRRVAKRPVDFEVHGRVATVLGCVRGCVDLVSGCVCACVWSCVNLMMNFAAFGRGAALCVCVCVTFKINIVIPCDYNTQRTHAVCRV